MCFVDEVCLPCAGVPKNNVDFGFWHVDMPVCRMSDLCRHFGGIGRSGWYTLCIGELLMLRLTDGPRLLRYIDAPHSQLSIDAPHLPWSIDAPQHLM